MQAKRTREKDFDIHNFLNVLEPYYRGGEYDFLLNSDAQLDLLTKRFIVFELDNIKDNKVLFPVVTLIIMETFISKMRRMKGERKLILLEDQAAVSIIVFHPFSVLSWCNLVSILKNTVKSSFDFQTHNQDIYL